MVDWEVGSFERAPRELHSPWDASRGPGTWSSSRVGSCPRQPQQGKLLVAKSVAGARVPYLVTTE